MFYSLYIDYLIFFDEQLSLLGLKETLNTYFYSIPTSIGSQLQPLVQLAFGIEHELYPIITQALAYYASSYLDVSNILSYCQAYTTPSTTLNNTTVMDTILFDLIRSDQRFDGKIEGNNTFQSSVKLLLKSKSDLIKTYMTAWSSATTCLDLNQRLDALIHTATLLSSSSSSRNHDLDWFLAGGQLIDSALAIKKLIRTGEEENDADLVHLLFLSMLCTFVVQGRPAIISTNTTLPSELDWETCIHTVIASSDPKAILALASIHKVAALPQRIDEPSLYLGIANTLAQFVLQDGTWIKGGVGWIH